MRQRITVATIMIGVAAAASCRSTHKSVVVPRDFRGELLLGCQTVGEESETTTVSAGETFAELKTCPKKTAPALDVIRDGKAVRAEVHWQRAGDGLITGVKIDVSE